MNPATRTKALNVVEWLEVSMRGLGTESHFDERVWWRAPTAPALYPGAVTFATAHAQDAVASTLAEVLARWGRAPFLLWDVGAELDLAPLGLRRLWTRPWYIREPSPFRGPEPAASFSRAEDESDLRAFERASKAGFESEEDRQRWHGRSTLEDGRVSYLLGRVGDAVVVSGVTFHAAGMVGLYGISTPPELRRRGYARALVHHVARENAHRLLGVWPDPASVPIYAEAGFVVGGAIAAWARA